MLMSFHRDLPNKPAELQAARSEQSEHPVQSPAHWRCLQWRGTCRSQDRQLQGCPCRMEWESVRAPVVTLVHHAPGGRSSEFLEHQRAEVPLHIIIHLQALSQCPDLWFWPFLFPRSPQST